MELQVRLDRAEADREELQKALRREREARENLEGAVAQLRQQMADSFLLRRLLFGGISSSLLLASRLSVTSVLDWLWVTSYYLACWAMGHNTEPPWVPFCT
ncbi:ski-like protein-like [Arapaima gigas]